MYNAPNLRQEVMERPIKDIIDELEDAMTLANESGDIKAVVHYANKVNELNDLVDFICEAEKDT